MIIADYYRMVNWFSVLKIRKYRCSENMFAKDRNKKSQL